MGGFDRDIMVSTGSDVGTHPNSESADNSTEFSRSGSDVTSIVNNTSNTSDSGSKSEVRVEGTSSGDPYRTWNTGTDDSWSLGVDTSDNSTPTLRFTYRDDENASPSSSTNNPVRFRIVDTVTGDCNTVFVGTMGLVSEGSRVGTTVNLNVQNVETTAGSDASINMQVIASESGGGNAYISYSGNVISFSHGQDKAESNSWKLVVGATFPGTIDVMTSTIDGEVTFPATPAFLATLATTVSNVTGDGTLYTVVYDTEIFDQNSDFDGASTFTAPVNGIYTFKCGIFLGGLLNTHLFCEMGIVTSNLTFLGNVIDPGNVENPDNEYSSLMTVTALMDAGDTCTTNITISEGTLVVDVLGDVTNAITYFSGKLDA